MEQFEALDVDEAFTMSAQRILKEEVSRTSRGLETKAIGPVMIKIQNPRARVLMNAVRKAKRHFMAGECIWILTGSNDLEQIAYYNPKMRQYSDDGKTLAGAYGPRLIEQFSNVMLTLEDDAFSRQAVINFWQPKLLRSGTKDTPCTISWQLRLNHGKMDMIAYMRSNDLWLGFPYDVFTFSVFQEIMSRAVGVSLGDYYHVVGDLHLYQPHWDLAKQCRLYSRRSEEMPPIKDTSPLKPLYELDRYIRLGGVTTEHDDPFIDWFRQAMLSKGEVSCK